MAEVIDLSEVVQTQREYEKIIRGQLTNEVIASYYSDMADVAAMDDDTETARRLKNKAANLRSCHRIMSFHHYRQAGVKDFQKTIYCHDRFCPICQKLKANTREKKFYAILSELDPKYDFYHMILTRTNVPGFIQPWVRADKNVLTLEPALRQMSKGYKKLMRYFSGNAMITGLDLPSFGYAGAVRTLEITFSDNQMYHPHFHSIVALKKGLSFPGATINQFSYDKFTGRVTPFSDFEILLQKIWYLILNGRKVTKKAIDGLRLGYSCMFKHILPSEIHEIFKYIVKPDKDTTMTPAIFQDLAMALKHFPSPLPYGCFRGYKLESEEIDDSNDPLYDKIVQALNRLESPIECSESPTAVRDNIVAKKCMYISRRSIRSFIRKMGYTDEDDLVVPVAAPEKAAEFFQTVLPGILDRPTSSLLYLDGGRSIKPKKAAAEPLLSVSDDDRKLLEDIL